MRIQPCLNCHRRPSCERYAATLKAVRGSGLTAGKLRCDAWTEDFPPGRRVSFLATSYDDSDGYSRACRELHTGTVLAIGRKTRVKAVTLLTGYELKEPQP